MAKNQEERLMLPAVQPVVGGHCESSALMNALHYLGYPFTEAQIVGGGGAIGFMFQKGGFPFLGGRSSTMREVFCRNAALSWQARAGEPKEESRQGAIGVLRRGIPVILRVDMRYLPYLYGGRYGSAHMSFGWHVITLFGIDFAKGTAYVSDTALPGLQAVKLADLEKARSSDTKVFPPRREYWWIEKKPAEYEPDWQRICRGSISEVVKSYEWRPANEEEAAMGLGGLEGLRDFPHVLLDFDSTVRNAFLLPPVFDFLHGCIETNGTGGAAFRIFYRDFLLDMAMRLKKPRLAEAAGLLDAAIVAWHDLADEFQRLARTIAKARGKAERAAQYGHAAEKAGTLYGAEKAFYEFLGKEP